MKKIVLLIICVLFLQACKEMDENAKEKNNEPEKETILPEKLATPDTVEMPSLELPDSKFHSVIGWLTNDEILFTLLDEGAWTVQSYSLSDKSWRTIYTSSIPIIQGYIHPNKEMILLHTSDNSSSAEVQIIHKNGQLVQNLSFESAELYMNWHATNADLIVFTAFYEDWTYSTFIYDGSTQNLTSIEVENPFVKWYDEEHLMVLRWSESSLDGGELMLYSIKENTVKETGIKHLLDVQVFGGTNLYVQINEQANQYEYRLVQEDTGQTFEWTSPAVSNYSEWVIPTISMYAENGIIAIRSAEAGNYGESSKNGTISSIALEGLKDFGEIKEQPIDCAPNGKVCLGGYEKENWIQLDPLKEQAWLIFKE